MIPIIGQQRVVPKASLRRVQAECVSLRLQLRQRDELLWVLLKRHGRQLVTVGEMEGMPIGNIVKCEVDKEANGFWFSASGGNEQEERSDDEGRS